MSENRWISLLFVTSLLVAVVLTIGGALATYDLASASGPQACARPAVHVNSIAAQFDAQLGAFVIRSDAAPTGVDGGLLAILGEVRRCQN